MNFQFRRDQFNLLVGLVLIILGGLFLAGELFDLRLGSSLWPLFIIVPGLVLFYFMASGGKEAAPLAIPGSLVTAVGLLLFYQNLTRHWESWAYAWALIFPTSFGIGLVIMGMRSENEGVRRTGEGFVRVGMIVFVVGGMFFELLIGIGGSRGTQILLPVLLIAFGGYTIWRQLSSRRPRVVDHEPQMDLASIEESTEVADTDLEDAAPEPPMEEE
jgi:hypothetical protein